MYLDKPHITIPKDWVEQFCKENHIEKMAFFGSVMSDRFSDSCDVDVLIEFHPKHIPGLLHIFDMSEQLMAVVGRSIDIRTLEDIHKFFQHSVIQQSYLIYGKERFLPT